MPVTLRKRLQCHYCGKRLNTAKRVGSKIKCDACLADNFFDTDDNFTDVPVEEVRRAGDQAPLAEVASESDVFCSTCLKNQYLYTAALAEYLPDEDHPSYEEIEKALPQYEKELDLRYPRCCRNCEPRVQDQLRRANYAAKSDHLQRKMQRDRNRRTNPAQYLRSWLITAAGMGTLASLLIQLFWHLLSSQANTDIITVGITPRQCFSQYPIPSQCTEYTATWMSYSLITAFLCFWWNPKWQDRLEGREERLVGLSRYYKIQLTVLAFRFAAWVVLRDLPGITQYVAPLHTLVFLLLVAISLYLFFGVVQVDKTPIVDWNKVQVPLVNPDQYEGPEVKRHSTPPSSQRNQPFLIEALASTSQSSPYEAWQPPTPPFEDDSMDWVPASQNFNPRPRIQKSRVAEKSPFYGTLPAKPIRGSLNPKIPSAPVQKTAIGLPPGFFGLSKSRDLTNNDPIAKPVKDVFAAPKFFADERQSDTGLEALFDTVFSVKDPRDVKPPSNRLTQKGATRSVFDYRNHSDGKLSNTNSVSQIGGAPAVAMLVSCAVIVILVILGASLVPAILESGERGLPSTVLPYLAIIPFLHILTDLMYEGTNSAPTLLFRTFEVACTGAAYFLVPKEGSKYVLLWNKSVVGIICVFLLREIYRFCQVQSAPPPISTAVKHHMKQSIQRIETDQIDDAGVDLAQSLQPQAVPVPQDIPPQSPPQLRTPMSTSYSTLRNRDSDESISTTASTQTTATSSGWKTPQHSGRTVNWQYHRNTPSESGAISRGLGGLTLSNDFGLGAGITGPRNRPAAGQNGTFNRYR